jgi:hypothetical protein
MMSTNVKRHLLAARRDAGEIGLVGSAEGLLGDHLIALGDHFVDGEVDVGEGVEEAAEVGIACFPRGPSSRAVRCG